MNKKRYHIKKRGAVNRTVTHSQRSSVGGDRESNGVGFVVISSDVDRDAYIKYVYQTGECIIITDKGDLIKDVKIPKHIIRDLVFPLSEEDRGSLISWQNVQSLGQVIITGILFSPGEIYPYNEQEKVIEYTDRNDVGEINQVWNASQPYVSLTVSYNEDDDLLSNEIGIHYKAKSPKSQTKLRLLCNGEAYLYGDVLAKVVSEEKVILQAGTLTDLDNNEVSSITIDKEGNYKYLDRYDNEIKIDGVSGVYEMTIKESIQFESPVIKLGKDAEQKGVLGDKLKGKIEDILGAIKQLTVPTALGPSGIPINLPAFEAIEASLNEILSEKNLIE